MMAPDGSEALVQVEANRYQARCGCMRTSPIVTGTRTLAKRLVEEFAWKIRDDEWSCPICSERKESATTMRASERRLRAIARTGTD